MDINHGLKLLGLNSTEEKIYLFILAIGTTEIYNIVHQTKIKRTTVYSAIDSLKQKRLVGSIEKSGQKEYFAENPKNISNILLEKSHQLSAKKQQLMQSIPELASLYNAHGAKPRIRIYEGDEGVKRALDETLDLPPDTETVAFLTDAKLPSEFLQNYVLDYVKQRVAKKISQRAIMNDSSFISAMQSRDKEELRNIILIDQKKYPFTDQVTIYGNCVSIISYTDKLALIIESAAIAESQRTIFELAWIGAQKVGKLSPNPYTPPKK